MRALLECQCRFNDSHRCAPVSNDTPPNLCGVGSRHRLHVLTSWKGSAIIPCRTCNLTRNPVQLLRCFYRLCPHHVDLFFSPMLSCTNTPLGVPFAARASVSIARK